MGGMSLTKDQQRSMIEQNRAVKQAGKKFISLLLLDITKNRIQGAMVLHARGYIDHATNTTQFHFEERGGPLLFVDDEMRGGSFCNMLDCEHNRRFLASMHGYRFWEIEDQEVLADIKNRAANLTKNAIIRQPEVPKETKMSDADIATEIARLTAEASKRTIAKAESGKIKPKIQSNIQTSPEAEKTSAAVNEEADVVDKALSMPTDYSGNANDNEDLPPKESFPSEETTVPATRGRGKATKKRKSSLVS